MSGEARQYSSVEYDLVPTEDMDEYLEDENKFKQLPWEDQM